MTLREIQDKVRVIMNEAGADEKLSLLSEDTVKLDDYITSCIPDAANFIMMVSPLRHLNPSSVSLEVEDMDGVGIISLPEDFLRLAAVKLNGWKRVVFTACTEGSEEYKVQSNPVTRSGVNKPCCALSYNRQGPVLECFPSGTLSFFHYIRSSESDPTGDGLEQLKPTLHLSVCYMCASLVYDIFEMPATSDRMKQVALDSIPKDDSNALDVR